MNSITLKDALQFLLIETQMVALHSAYGKSVHSIVAKHIEDIEFASEESKRITTTSIRQSTAKAVNTGGELASSINKVQQEFNSDVIWQKAIYCKVVTVSKTMHEAGIAKGDIFKVMLLDYDNKVWVRSDGNFTCWFYSYSLLPLSQLEDEPKLTSIDTIRGRKVALELKEFRENLKAGDKVKFKSALGMRSTAIKSLQGNLVDLLGYWGRTKDQLYPVDFKYKIE